MSFTLTDAELDAICRRSDYCGGDCMGCEAFAANIRHHRINDHY